jgi:SET domain-containing protein
MQSYTNTRPERLGGKNMASTENPGLCIPYTIRVTPEKGRGVFADAAIRKGMFVWRHAPGQYAVYDEQSLADILVDSSDSEAAYELAHMFGLAEFPGYMIRVFDDGVLINHSAEPTLMMNRDAGAAAVPSVASAQEVVDALLDDRFALVAARDMEVGDELTHDYNADVDDPPYYDDLCKQYGVTWDWL